jgi:tripartite-type tricarboxylate transporter receptor subunit TctC
MNNKFLKSIVSIALCASAGAYAADVYPTKTVTMVVPFAAGGPTDTVARLVAQSMSTTLKQTSHR